MRQDEGRNLREVAQQVALGERRLLQRRIRGPVHSIEVSQADPVRPHCKRERCFGAFQLCHDIFNRPARARRPARRVLGLVAANRLRIDVVAQPEEHRRA